MAETTKKPNHIAIIMDGNGRWAEARHLPRMAGHRSGTENLRRIIKACVKFEIPYLTVYAFSTENWKRPSDEVNGLMQILAEVLEREVAELHKEGVRIVHIGRLEHLNKRLQKGILNAIELTKDNDHLTLCIAWNYGGRDEIAYAIQRMIEDGVKAEDVNEETISSYMFTKGIPDPDLMIRTSGEMRTSNFLIWQSSYAEWYFTDTLWPDFDEQALEEAIQSFAKRERRFGRRTPKEEHENYAG
jgi:undecaprenyl diphosphate synthase